MNQNEEVLDLDLKALLFYVLRQWKPIISFALALALLLGGAMGFSEFRKGQNSSTVEVTQEGPTRQTTYQDHVAFMQKKISDLQLYLNESVLMNNDCRTFYIAQAVYHIDSESFLDQLIPGEERNPMGSPAWYYASCLQDSEIYTQVAAEIGMETRYLMELIFVEISDSGDTLSVRVAHPDEQSARLVLETAKARIEAMRAQLEETLDKHTLTLVMTTCSVSADDTIRTLQNNVNTDMTNYQKLLTTSEGVLEDLGKASGPKKVNVPKALVKGGILGGLAGGFVAVVFFFAAVILRNRVYSPELLLSGCQLPVLGELFRPRARGGKILKLLNRLEGRQTENTEETLRFVAQNIRNHAHGVSSILVCSDIKAEESAKFADTMKKYAPELHFEAAGSLLKDAHALQAMTQCDTVLRLVTRDHTSNKDLHKELALVSESGKSMLGFLFIS